MQKKNNSIFGTHGSLLGKKLYSGKVFFFGFGANF
jgi:hypothetical protein